MLPGKIPTVVLLLAVSIESNIDAADPDWQTNVETCLPTEQGSGTRGVITCTSLTFWLNEMYDDMAGTRLVAQPIAKSRQQLRVNTRSFCSGNKHYSISGSTMAKTTTESTSNEREPCIIAQLPFGIKFPSGMFIWCINSIWDVHPAYNTHLGCPSGTSYPSRISISDTNIHLACPSGISDPSGIPIWDMDVYTGCSSGMSVWDVHLGCPSEMSTKDTSIPDRRMYPRWRSQREIHIPDIYLHLR